MFIFCSFLSTELSHFYFFEKKKRFVPPKFAALAEIATGGKTARFMCLRFVSRGWFFLSFRIFFFCFLPLIFTLRDKCVRVLAKLTINLYLIQCFNFCSYFTHLLSTFSPARLLVFLFVKFIQFQVLSLARLPLNNFLLVFVVSLTSHAHHRAKRLSTLLSSLFCRHS